MWAARPTRGATGGPPGPCRVVRAGPYVRLYEHQIHQGTDSSGGECIERQSFLHTASGWLSLICLIAALVLLALKHKNSLGAIRQGGK
jgi:hypothetical protein